MRSCGSLIENVVQNELERQGLKLLQKNYFCKLGEIDLIMLDQQTIVFIEVRYRQNPAYGDGIASVTPSKQHKIQKAARCYLQAQGLYDNVACRFDIVSVTGSDPHYRLNWLRDAFWDQW